MHFMVAALSAVVVLNAVGDSAGRAAAELGMIVLFVATYGVGVWPTGALPMPGRRGWWWTAALTAEWLLLLWLSVHATYLVFALFFLYMRLFSGIRGTLAVVLSTGVAVAAFGLHRGFDIAGVIGPVLGAGVAVVISLGYQALTREAEQRQVLIEELTRTKDRLATAERAAGAVEERERLAREIHDTVSQSLSSIIMLLHAAQRSGAGSVSGQHRLEQARAAATDALGETREFIHALAPPSLRTGGIAEALARLGRRTEEATGLHVEVSVPEQIGSLSTPLAAALLRLAQSALANVTQHANATRADVTLTRLDDEIILDVVDDGDGFDPTRIEDRRDDGGRPSFGLVAMRDRTADLGGTLVVESSEGHGTSVVASFAVTS